MARLLLGPKTMDPSALPNRPSPPVELALSPVANPRTVVVPACAARSGVLTRERERELLLAYAATRDAAALGELVRAHRGLVHRIVRHHNLSVLSREDLVAEATLGLIEAAWRFDPRFDVRFATYAAHWVRAKVQEHSLRFRRIVAPPDTRASRRILGRGRRTESRLAQSLGRAPTSEELAAALEVEVGELEEVRAVYDSHDVVAEDDGATQAASERTPSPEDVVADAEELRRRHRALSRAMGRLPTRERDIIERRQLSCEPPTLATLAQEMSLSHERVRQLELRAMRRLGEALDGHKPRQAPPRRAALVASA